MKYLKFYKKYLHLIISFFLFIFLLPQIILICKIIFKNKNKHIFGQPEGGFGHTITTPLYLYSLYEKNWLLFYAYQKGRHNKYIKELFPDNLFFVNVNLFNSRLSLNLFFRKLYFKFLGKIIQLIFKIKINDYITFLFDNKKKDETYNDHIYFQRFESLIWKNIVNNSNKFVINSNLFINLNKNNFNLKKNFKKKICFTLRYKGNKKYFNNNKYLINDKNFDLGNMIRDSRDIEDYKFIINDLVSKKYQVIISGDECEYPDWIMNSGDEILTFNKTDCKLDHFQFKYALESDIHIGVSSGGMLYSMFKKKNLFLETYELGAGYNNTIVSYPFIKAENAKDLGEIIMTNNYKWDKEFFMESGIIKPLKISDLNLIYLDFIDNISNENYGISPKTIGIHQGMLTDSNSKFSNKWIELIGL